MLIPMPKELLDNPECYRENADGFYTSTEIATEEERKAVDELNKQWTYVLEKRKEAENLTMDGSCIIV